MTDKSAEHPWIVSRWKDDIAGCPSGGSEALLLLRRSAENWALKERSGGSEQPYDNPAGAIRLAAAGIWIIS